MRGLEQHIAWFEGAGNTPIREPPLLPPTSGIEPFDLFLHRIPAKGDVQAWRWEPQSSDSIDMTWRKLTIGKELKVPGLNQPRIFVLTEQGKPSFVTPGTIERRYNNMETDDDDISVKGKTVLKERRTKAVA